MVKTLAIKVVEIIIVLILYCTRDDLMWCTTLSLVVFTEEYVDPFAVMVLFSHVFVYASIEYRKIT